MLDVRAVLFDFDHTLGFDHHLEADVLAAMAAEHGGTPQSDVAITGVLARFRDGSVSVSQAIADAFAAWGCDACDPDVVAADYKARCLAQVPLRVTAAPGAMETVHALRGKGCVVGVFSNGWTDLQLAKLVCIGYTGPAFISEQLGFWKPDRRAFEAAASKIGLDPMSIAYVGDNPRVDVVGSKAAGMQAVWIDADDEEYPAGLPQPDIVIRTLPELLSFA